MSEWSKVLLLMQIFKLHIYNFLIIETGRDAEDFFLKRSNEMKAFPFR